jgi:hypothetical protein
VTLEDRASALEYLGFNARQTRFIVTVALHGGYCLRRHYAQVAGLSYGAGVRDFLDRLVARGLARRQTFRRDRGHVYHLHHSHIYEALGEADNRNRRRASPALVARKLMLLDYVLAAPTWTWLATETDKVDYFTTGGVPRWALPQRRYVGQGLRDGPASTTRYFVHKLPIGLRPDDSAVTFVVLVTDTRSLTLPEFLADHRSLLGQLRRWRVVALLPARLAGRAACVDAFRRFLSGRDEPWSATERDDLRFALPIFDRIARGDSLAGLSIADLHRGRAIRMHHGPEAFDRLRLQWRVGGEAALADVPLAAIRAALLSGAGRLETEWLPRRCDRFGTRPGVS